MYRSYWELNSAFVPADKTLLTRLFLLRICSAHITHEANIESVFSMSCILSGHHTNPLNLRLTSILWKSDTTGHFLSPSLTNYLEAIHRNVLQLLWGGEEWLDSCVSVVRTLLRRCFLVNDTWSKFTKIYTHLHTLAHTHTVHSHTGTHTHTSFFAML